MFKKINVIIAIFSMLAIVSCDLGKEDPVSDYDLVSEAGNALDFSKFIFSGSDNNNSVSSDFKLPTNGLHSSVIKWVSDTESVVTISGGNATVSRPALGSSLPHQKWTPSTIRL